MTPRETPWPGAKKLPICRQPTSPHPQDHPLPKDAKQCASPAPRTARGASTGCSQEEKLPTSDNNDRKPETQRPTAQGPDPAQTLLLALAFALMLGSTGYLCLAHPSLTAPIAAVGGFGAAPAAAFGIAIHRRSVPVQVPGCTGPTLAQLPSDTSLTADRPGHTFGSRAPLKLSSGGGRRCRTRPAHANQSSIVLNCPVGGWGWPGQVRKRASQPPAFCAATRSSASRRRRSCSWRSRLSSSASVARPELEPWLTTSTLTGA